MCMQHRSYYKKDIYSLAGCPSGTGDRGNFCRNKANSLGACLGKRCFRSVGFRAHGYSSLRFGVLGLSGSLCLLKVGAYLGYLVLSFLAKSNHDLSSFHECHVQNQTDDDDVLGSCC